MPYSFAVPEEMKIQYLRRKIEELSVSREHVALKNFDSVKTMAHQMKGNASSFEFPLLAQLAEVLETASINGNQGEVTLSLDDIQKAVDGLLRRLLKPKV